MLFSYQVPDMGCKLQTEAFFIQPVNGWRIFDFCFRVHKQVNGNSLHIQSVLQWKGAEK